MSFWLTLSIIERLTLSAVEGLVQSLDFEFATLTRIYNPRKFYARLMNNSKNLE
jgi:hypothetical protein